MNSSNNSFLVSFAYTTNVLVDQIGLLLFIALIIITVKHKNLHGTCHRLIGVYAVGSLLSKLIILVPYSLFLFPALFPSMPLFLCTALELLPMMGQISIFPTMLAIGADRVLSIFFPLWYLNRNEKLYFPIAGTLSSLYSFLFGFLMVKHAAKAPNNQVLCQIGDLFDTSESTLLGYPIFGFNLLTISCYAVILLKLFCEHRKGQASNQQTAVTLFKSLALVMGIQVGGWTISLALPYIVRAVAPNLTAAQQKVVDHIGYCLCSLSSTVEVPAIYFTSAEHRNAFRKQFLWFFRLFSTQSTGSSSNVVMVSNFNTVAGFYQQQQKQNATLKRNNNKMTGKAIARVSS